MWSLTYIATKPPTPLSPRFTNSFPATDRLQPGDYGVICSSQGKGETELKYHRFLGSYSKYDDRVVYQIRSDGVKYSTTTPGPDPMVLKIGFKFTSQNVEFTVCRPMDIIKDKSAPYSL